MMRKFSDADLILLSQTDALEMVGSIYNINRKA